MSGPPMPFDDCSKCVAGRPLEQDRFQVLPKVATWGDDRTLCQQWRDTRQCPRDKSLALIREWLRVQQEQAIAQREQAAAMRELAAAMRDTGNTGPIWTVAEPGEVVVYNGR